MEEKKKHAGGRPKKPKTEPTKAEKIAENNARIEEVNRQLQVVSQKFIENPTPFFEEREREIARVIEQYGDLQNEDLQNGIISKKDYALALTEYLIKPLLPKQGSPLQHTPSTLSFTSEFYWEKIVLPLNEKVSFIPNIHDLLTLLNISSQTFLKYANDGNEEMRETCQMIKDKFISYYQRKGLAKECSEIMAMFVLKTTFQQRENDVPQVMIANVNNSPDEKIAKYARQNGFEVWNEE